METTHSHETTAPPRSCWAEGFICIATFGLYLPIWFYLAARDLKRVNASPLTPWMWFFVPLLAITSPFALPILMQQLRLANDKLGLPQWQRWQRWMWLGVMISLMLASSIVGALDLSFMVQIGILFGVCLWLLPVHHQLNQIRRHSQSEPAFTRYGPFNPLEWVSTVVIGALLVASLAAIIMLRAPLLLVDTLPKGTVVEDKHARFSLTLNQPGWKHTASPIFTNGTAQMELVGPRDVMWYAVFLYGANQTFSHLTNSRYDAFVADMQAPKCATSRQLIDGSTYVKGTIVCRSENGAGGELYVATLIEGKYGFTELTGFFADDSDVLDKHKDTFIDDAQGLKRHD